MVELLPDKGFRAKMPLRLVLLPFLLLYFLCLGFSTLLPSGEAWGGEYRYALALSCANCSTLLVLVISAIHPFLSLALYGKTPFAIVLINFLMPFALGAALIPRYTDLLLFAPSLLVPSATLGGLLVLGCGWGRTTLKPWSKILAAMAAVAAPILALLAAGFLGHWVNNAYLRVH